MSKVLHVVTGPRGIHQAYDNHKTAVKQGETDPIAFVIADEHAKVCAANNGLRIDLGNMQGQRDTAQAANASLRMQLAARETEIARLKALIDAKSLYRKPEVGGATYVPIYAQLRGGK